MVLRAAGPGATAAVSEIRGAIDIAMAVIAIATATVTETVGAMARGAMARGATLPDAMPPGGTARVTRLGILAAIDPDATARAAATVPAGTMAAGAPKPTGRRTGQALRHERTARARSPPLVQTVQHLGATNHREPISRVKATNNGLLASAAAVAAAEVEAGVMAATAQPTRDKPVAMTAQSRPT